ncbi:MAG: Fic family protein [Anaerolineae bacterium]|nr:Fic family protein [Anaerolineae bacterium]
MKPELFQTSSAGEVIKIGTGEVGYWAFVPNPLPPKLDLSRALIKKLSTADHALGELSGLGRMLTNPDLLVLPFTRREAVLSSRIEGTQATIYDLYAYEAGQLYLPGLTPGVPLDDVKEVVNYVKALEYGLAALQRLPISLRLIREIHAQLMSGVRGDKATPGEFRRTQNWIGRPGCTLREADFVPPPIPQMLEALNQWEKYIHQEDDNPALIRLALIHYQFEAIHPFLDGNGRVGRLLNTFLLITWGLLSHPLLYLSAYFQEHRTDYYELLRGVSERGDWENWLLFFLDGIITQANDAISRAKQLQDLQVVWRQRLTERVRVSALTIRLADHLFANPITSIPQVQNVLQLSYPGAKRIVGKLIEFDILRPMNESNYKKLYMATEILKIIGYVNMSEDN